MRIALTTLALVWACCSAQAGTVSVRFTEPDKFLDAGHGSALADTQRVLSEHFTRLANSALPASQSLEIEVLDIDLAGEMQPWRRIWPDVRVMRGKADWPRITLRFTLRDGERVMAQGEDRLSDMNYLQGGHLSQLRQSEPLPYERRMVTTWFNQRLLGQR